MVPQGLPFTTKAKVNKMKDMIDADNHFSKLQDKLHRSQPPCIPHIGNAPSSHRSRLADAVIIIRHACLIVGWWPHRSTQGRS
jgi:hypothetical protein